MIYLQKISNSDQNIALSVEKCNYYIFAIRDNNGKFNIYNIAHNYSTDRYSLIKISKDTAELFQLGEYNYYLYKAIDKNDIDIINKTAINQGLIKIC